MFVGDLREYQDEARERTVERLQMLMAMTMGAGKTATTLAAIEQLAEEGVVRSGIVIVPASLKYQWLAEIKKFTDTRAIVIDGTKAQRTALYKHAHKYRYVIINYEALLFDWDFVKKLPRDFIVLDEATAIKGLRSKRTKAVKRLRHRAPVRIALSGQPIENLPEEVFSIMEFVDPEVLGPFDRFDETFIVRDRFGKPVRYRNLKILHKALSEAMVRVSRADIAEFLPKVVEQSIPVPMTAKNRELYNYITMDLLGVLEEALSSFGASFDLWRHYGRHSDSDEEANRLRGEIMSRQLCLRMLCDHPLLLKKSADLYDNDDEDAVGSSGGSKYAAQLKDAGLLDGLTHSPKLDTVVADIKEILREDRVNKVVVFSFFKGMLKYLQDALGEGTCVQFHGGMNARRKDAAKQRFSNDPKCRVFLSSDAGGYGVDLPMANYLISFDLPWSAGKLDQRNARIIRLSSQFEYVVVQNYVIRGSLEERQYEMLMQKRGIGEAFIDGKYDKSGNFELTLTSLREFLIRSEV